MIHLGYLLGFKYIIQGSCRFQQAKFKTFLRPLRIEINTHFTAIVAKRYEVPELLTKYIYLHST